MFFWNKPLPAVEVERKHRTVVPNHLVPGSPKVRHILYIKLDIQESSRFDCYLKSVAIYQQL